jgi:hypothetical protein
MKGDSERRKTVNEALSTLVIYLQPKQKKCNSCEVTLDY